MLKICGDIICKPLELIFKQVLTTACFRLNGKEAILSLVKKECDKQNRKSYHPVFLISSFFTHI